jgi:hypothetical protein
MKTETMEQICKCGECAECKARAPKKRRSKKLIANAKELRRRLAGLIADAGIAQSQLDKGDYFGAEHSINEVACGFARVMEQACDTFDEIPGAERPQYPDSTLAEECEVTG